MTYDFCKTVISGNSYDRADMLEKLDVFRASGRITQAEYDELAALASGSGQQNV